MAITDKILTDIGTDEISTLEQLYNAQTLGAPSNVHLPFANNIYDVDLKARKIYGPDFISVQRDHKAEVIYFKVDRFIDYMDLANTACVIEYILPGDSRVPYIYIVPFYDTTKFATEGKMIFPWNVGGVATAKGGTIEYAIRFFRVDGSGKNTTLAYSLSTLSTKSKILPSIEGDGEIMKAEYDIPIGEAFETLVQQATDNRTYWTIL